MTPNLKEYLSEMTAIALKYDLIIAQPVEAIPPSYDTFYGPMLCWDQKYKCYILYDDGHKIYPSEVEL